MLVDSHCHLDGVDLAPYDGDFTRLMEATRAAGVARLLCVAIDLERYPAMRTLVEPFAEVSVSVGVHPNEHDGHEPSPDELVALAADPRVVAIGETGLDYYRSTGGDPGWQAPRFRRHIAVARAVGRPLIVHSRAARADTIRILNEEQARDVGGVLHCFTEDWEMARQALDLGFYISFSGIVTFKAADALREVAGRVPLDRLLIETDSPYLAPVPYRGRSNEPKYVAAVADCVAGLRGMETDALVAATAENFFRLFDHAPRSLPGEAAPP
ncbi:hydrolase, TatD family [Thioflavicoccus mobilis 8321]|uniref:Hydrolase, TatD family n=1 Tax=Thioflavicoccus mobilis 8321 TaxID=765912 RepID=L0GWH8_9GAMM|nr:TatD family hydrolase [Thioflavicoccus mobilis]AGA91108.1 hydrolase, TatD family [Thioflavicoccus mobilis 8321]